MKIISKTRQRFRCVCCNCIRKTFFMAPKLLIGHSLLIIEATLSYSDTPHSVGFLWTSDRPDAETSTWQHTTHTKETDIHAPSGIGTRNRSMRAAVDRRLRPRGHRDRHVKLNNVACPIISNMALKKKVFLLLTPCNDIVLLAPEAVMVTLQRRL